MGQSKGGGYDKVDTLTPDVQRLIQDITGQASGNQSAAAAGFREFLPGGGGGQAIKEAANKNFQQQTIPSILNSFQSGSKSSSALNQSLAAGASNLNTNLSAQLAQMQLQAAQGLGGLGTSQAGIAAGTPQFDYMKRQLPFWQQLLLSGTQAAGGAAGSAASTFAGGF